MAATHTHVPFTTIPDDGLRAAAEVLAGIGDRWTVFVIHALWPGPLRHRALQRAVGEVSQRMLTFTLRRMERDGLVTRTVRPAVPPQVEYALTGLGRSLVGPLHALYAWIVEHRPELAAARARHAAEHTSG